MNPKEKAEVVIIVLKRIAKWIAILIAIFASIIFAGWGYDRYTDYKDSKPKLIIGINGIDLNEKLSDVLFKNKGFEQKPVNEVNPLGDVYYENNETGASFFATNNLIVHVNRYCMKEYEYTSINGISCISTGEDIAQKYGKDLLVQCLKDKKEKFYIEHRVYDVQKYGIRYHLFSNKVAAFSVTTPERLKGYTGHTWVPCE